MVRPRQLHPILAGLPIAGILFLAAADVTVVSTLLPSIAKAIGGESLFPWLMSIFMAAMALSGMCAGALADRHGIRRVLSTAVLLFVAASMGAGFAPDIHALLAARLVQGVGAGMIIVLSYSSLSLLYGASGRSMAQSLIGITWGGAAVLGPLLGILALRYFDWRFVFLINLPIGIVCLLAFRASLPPIAFEDKLPFDWPAQLAFAVLIFASMIALSAHSLALSQQMLLGLLATGLLALLVLVLRVRRDTSISPLPLPFLQSRPLLALTIAVPCASMGLYASITFLPAILSEQGQGSQITAMGVACAAAGFVVMSSLSARLLDLLGCRLLMAIGVLSLSIGCLMISLIPSQAGLALVIAAQWLIGQGMGIVAVAAVLHAQAVAPAHQLSTYTSAVQVLRNIGAALGINLFASVKALVPLFAATASTEHITFQLLALLLALCVLPLIFLPGKVLGGAIHQALPNETTTGHKALGS